MTDKSIRYNRLQIEWKPFLTPSEQSVIDQLLFRSNLEGYTRFYSTKVGEECNLERSTVGKIFRKFPDFITKHSTTKWDAYFTFNYENFLKWIKQNETSSEDLNRRSEDLNRRSEDLNRRSEDYIPLEVLDKSNTEVIETSNIEVLDKSNMEKDYNKLDLKSDFDTLESMKEQNKSFKTEAPAANYVFCFQKNPLMSRGEAVTSSVNIKVNLPPPRNNPNSQLPFRNSKFNSFNVSV